MPSSAPPVFRFAPSPNGALHLGHAYSALVNQQICAAIDGTCLLRLEDIDQTRCTPELAQQMLDDLTWLGIDWHGEPRRQSEHFADYRRALQKLRADGLIYPAFMSRGDIRRMLAQEVDASPDENWPRDPDGSPHYPGDERNWSLDQQQAMLSKNQKHSWRLNMAAALQLVPDQLYWREFEESDPAQSRNIPAKPELWGDVVLARSDTPTSYHLAVTVDDALQEVTHVVRGRDLYHATSVHRLLQVLLDLPAPRYHHHDLVIGPDGRKLSKSNGDVSLRALRRNGVDPANIAQHFTFAA
ncbi:MAG: tRNA glutamyl-Q(34) synthetase GluQRS [Rhizobiaceae bacterium]|nr:tRNA glutamyl-Q(34) synthetase GluQRS [Rhizobiaceae bacterium]